MASVSRTSLASVTPKVTLVNAFAEPPTNAIATARTCYMSWVNTPFDVAKDERARDLRGSIAKSTYEAGHRTTTIWSPAPIGLFP